MVVLFYPMEDNTHRVEIYSHEKRHIEDRVLEFYGVNDIESAGLLSGFLGEKFYEFWKIVTKGSEDEKIRKWIKKELESKYVVDNIVNNVMADKAFAWLEKQGEKGTNGNNEEIPNSEQKPTDKGEPKFKIGDKIRKKTPSSFDTDMEVARIDKDYYVCNHIGKFSSEVIPFSEESYYELVEHKHAWSEEDEGMLNSFLHKLEVCDLLSNKEVIWIKDKFKSLKERYTWKPSSEQIEALDFLVYNTVPDEFISKKIALKVLSEQLKKLREE